MLSWLSANLVNILLVAVIALAVALAVRGILRNKKTGGCSCGGACAACQGCGRRPPKAGGGRGRTDTPCTLHNNTNISR